MSELSKRPLDVVATAISALTPVEIPLIHRFTPGLYIREIQLPKGSLTVSKIHKTEHPFVISKGHVEIWSEESGSVHCTASHVGITQPGTQRAVFAHEDSTWLTFHPTSETDPEKIEEEIIQKPDPGSITIGEALMSKLKAKRLQ